MSTTTGPAANHSSSGYGDIPPEPDALPLPVVDNHCHLDIDRDRYDPNGEHMLPIERIGHALDHAARVGVDRVVQIGCTLESARYTVEIIERDERMLGGVAIHPNEAPRILSTGGRAALDAAYAEIERLAAHPRVRVVGETGLDYFRTEPAGRDAQIESFIWHIELAKRTGKALQIHDRDAHDDVLRLLAEHGAPDTTVLHCFSGDIVMAQECVERGYHLSFAGTVTFKNAGALRNALAVVPLRQVLVETDAPYLTPAPYRGATNAPYLVPLTVRTMAGVLGVSVPELCQALSENAERLYGPW